MSLRSYAESELDRIGMKDNDPYKSESKIYGIKVDRRNRSLESKHPELAAISYDKYDELASQLYTLEVLKKDFKNGK